MPSLAGILALSNQVESWLKPMIPLLVDCIGHGSESRDPSAKIDAVRSVEPRNVIWARVIGELRQCYPLIKNTTPEIKSIVVMILGNTCSGTRLSIILPI